MIPIALVCWLAAMVGRARSVARESQCHGNMSFLAIGLLNVRTANGRFPPAATMAPDGKPMHGWRALALQPNLGLSFRPYDLAQPWDSPGNVKAAAGFASIFACPNTQGDPPRFANYVAVVDRSGVSTLDLANMTGPRSLPPAERIHFIEFPDSTIRWDEPRDLAFEDLETLGPGRDPRGLGVIFADAHFRRMPRGELIETLRLPWKGQR